MPDRSFHFIPCHRPQLFERVGALGADHVVFDLEDSVPRGDKDSARRAVADFLQRGCQANWYVRIHAVDSAEFSRDAELLAQFPSLGVVIPKFEQPHAWKLFASRVNGPGRRIIILIESFHAADALATLLDTSPVGLYGVGLGMEDLLATSCFDAGQLETLVQYLRCRLAVTSLARGLLPIDAICGEIRDVATIEHHALVGRSAGMVGKFTIHPTQIAVVNRVFSADAAAQEWARTIVELSTRDDEPGYRRVGDVILTPPKVKKAQTILRARGETDNG